MPARDLAVDQDALLRASTARDEGLLGTWLDLGTGRLLERRDDAEGQALEARLEAEPDRFVKVPLYTREYRLMAAFVDEVEDDELAKELDAALSGPAAFRAWELLLATRPAERRQWATHRTEALRRWAAGWLATLDVEVAWAPARAAAEVPALLALALPTGESSRTFSTEAEAQAVFVRAARDLCELLREPFPSRRIRAETRLVRNGLLLQREGRTVTIRLRAEAGPG